jgi:hypothetical protein
MKKASPVLLISSAILIGVPTAASAQSSRGHLFSDNFSTTTGLSSSWQVTNGTFTTNGTYAISGSPPSSPNTGNWAMVVPSFGTSNYAVSADIIVPPFSLSSGLTVRSSDPYPANFSSTLYAAILSTDGTVNLYRRNSWAWTSLASVNIGIAANTSYTLRFVVVGYNPVHLEAWVNGTLRASYDDTSTARITTGAAGMQNYDAGVKYANFKIDPVQSYVFFDGFRRTTGLGSAWQAVNGGYATDGTYAVSNTPPSSPNTGNWALVTAPIGTNDYSVSADIIIPPFTLVSGVVARSSDPNPANFSSTLYSAQLSTDGSVKLYRRNNWAWTLLSSVVTGIVANTTYTLKLVVAGSNPVHLEAWVNGTQKISYDDSSSSRILSGACGMENYDAGVKYTNFTLDAPSPGPSGGDAAWINQTNTSTAATTIYKSGGQNGVEDAGGASQQAVASGNATFRYVVDEVNRLRFAGLSRTSTWQGAANIDFAFRMQTGHADIYENGVYKVAVLVSVGDVLRIDVVDAVGRYFKNGVLLYTSGLTPVFPLYAVTSLIDSNATVGQSKLTGHLHAPYRSPVFNGSLPSRMTVKMTGTGAGTVDGALAPNPPVIHCVAGMPSGVNLDKCDSTFDFGSNVTFTASPAANSVFSGWSDSCAGSGTNTTCVVQGLGDQTITARFDGPPQSKAPYACGNSPCGQGAFPPAAWHPYGPDSAFNKPIQGATANKHPRSHEIITRMLTVGDLPMHNHPNHFLTPNDGSGGWPTYWGGNAGDQTYTVVCGYTQQQACQDPAFTQDCSVKNNQLKAPIHAIVQGNDPTEQVGCGPDRHMTIIDQTNQLNKEFDLWHVSVSPLPPGTATITTQWSGYTYVLDGDGRAIGSAGQGTAGRVGNLAGRVRFEELDDAVRNHSFIKHVLAITVPCNSAETPYYPATGYGFFCNNLQRTNPTNVDAPPMGARIALNLTQKGPDADLRLINGSGEYQNDLTFAGVPEWKKVFLRTLSKYGAIIMDTDGNDANYFGWQMEPGNQYTSLVDPQTGTSLHIPDPWLQFGQTWTGTAYTQCGTGTPGNDFVVDCFTSGGGFAGLWNNDDAHTTTQAIHDWTATVWSNLEVLLECANKTGENGC